MIEQLPVVLAALIVGATVGLTGVGAGAIMTPALILLFGVPPAVAIATDLVFATVTKLASAAIHSRAGSIDWSAARGIWAGSVPGVLAGSALLVFLHSRFDSALSLILVAVLLFSSFSMLRSTGKARRVPMSRSKTAMGGAVIGFSVATTSVGAGALGMVLLRAKLGDFDPKRLVGTDIIHAIPIALIAGVSYFFAGFIDFNLLLPMLIGSIPGVLIGSLLTGTVSPVLLRRVLAVVIAIAAVSILFKALGLS